MQSRSLSDRAASIADDVFIGGDVDGPDESDLAADSVTDALPTEAKETSLQPTEAEIEGVSDAVLLKRFLKSQDEAAFVALVQRYERLVMGVALRQVGDRHRAEDVFQATFLVLAERARRIRKPKALAGWLHGTARRIGLRALSQQKLQPLMPGQTPEPAVDAAPLEVMQQAFEQQTLDEQLAKLPERLRLPLILHYLDGLTAKEVADRLDLPVTTVEGRLKMGRNQLRERLVKHGVGFGVVLAAFGLSQKLAAASAVSAASTLAGPSLVGSTLTSVTAQSAANWFRQQQLADCSANAVRLASQEIAVMTTAKITTTLLTTAAVCLAVGVGATVAWGQFGGGGGFASPPVSPGSQWVQHDVDGDAGESVTLQGRRAKSSKSRQDLYGGENTESADDSYGGGAGGYGGAGGEMYGGTGGGMEAMGMGGMGFGMEAMGLNPQQILDGAQDYRSLSPSRQKIERTLDTETIALETAGESLDAFAAALSEQLQIPVTLDTQALEDMGITSDEPLKTLPGELMAHEALGFLLSGLDLTYIIRNGVLTITTTDVAHELREVAIYEVRHLGNNYPPQDVAMLMESVTPNAMWWNVDGEGGTIKIIPGGVVVKQTQQAHREIRGLLKQLEQFAARTDLPAAARDPKMMQLNEDFWVPGQGASSLGGGGGGGFGGGPMGGGYFELEDTSADDAPKKNRKRRNRRDK